MNMSNEKLKPRKRKKELIALLFILIFIRAGTATAILVHNSRTASSLEGVTYTVKSETYENQIDVSGYIDTAEI